MLIFHRPAGVFVPAPVSVLPQVTSSVPLFAVPKRSSLYVDSRRPYARVMRTQFALWLGMILSGLTFMAIVSFSGR